MTAKYLKMVGQLQWLVTLGRFDIHAQVATMSRFRAAPKQGHMDRLKRIYSIAIRTKDYAIRFRTEQPDYSFLPDQDFDWTYSVNGDVHEILPDDMPEPLGDAVTTTTTMDANLNHCLATGKSLTGCLHFVNKTPVDWYSKKQATVETATYGSEVVAAKTATEPIMDIRQTDRIPSTTPGAEPPRDDRDSGSARSHSMHLETSSSDRPKMVTYTEPQTVPSYISVKCTRRTLRKPSFTRAAHAQPSLSNFPRRDSDLWRVDPLTRDDPGGTKFSHFPPK